MRPFVFLLFALFSYAPDPVLANDILPVAQGRHTVTFVLDEHVPLPPVGAWVSFHGTTNKNVPVRLRINDGFVLGSRDDVVFVEVSEGAAAWLAHQRARQTVRIRKSRDPNPDTVADRRNAAETGQPVLLAPRMVTVTVSVPVAKTRVEAWERGTGLTFVDAHEIKRISYSDERVTSHYYDVFAHFVSAVQTGESQFDVTVIVKPDQATFLLKAEAQNRLRSVRADGEKSQATEREARCYVTQRTGREHLRIEIPCG